MKPPLRIGIIGMGGFAGAHHDTVRKLEDRGVMRLVCTCDPEPARFQALQQHWQLGAPGVRVFGDYREMLEACHADLDMVVIPTPIQLHAEMHAAAASYGLPSYLEKPPTLDYAELDRMIQRDATLRRASLVGFNFIIEPTRLSLKERVLAGEFGAVRGATLTALWPRPVDYFRRAPWAGRLEIEGRMVLDSCLGNALAHFVHNLLFWAGRGDLMSWAQLTAVRGELYRAHSIQGADTFFVEADTTGGVNMRVAVSHACANSASQAEVVICEQATIRYVIGQTAEIRWCDGRIERLPLDPFDPLLENHLEYARYLRGSNSRPATTLTDSRPFVALHDLAYVSSGRITQIPPDRVSQSRDDKDQKDYLSVAGLQIAQDAFVQHGIWPSTNGWGATPGEVVGSGDLSRFHDVIRQMVADATPPAPEPTSQT